MKRRRSKIVNFRYGTRPTVPTDRARLESVGPGPERDRIGRAIRKRQLRADRWANETLAGGWGMRAQADLRRALAAPLD